MLASDQHKGIHTIQSSNIFRVFGGCEEYFYPDGWTSGSFRVEEFRVPSMKGIIQPPKEPLINISEVDIDLLVAYLSGGGASNAPVKLRSQIQQKYTHFENYEDFTFANGEIQTVSTKMPLWPSKLLLGIKPDSWASSKESFKFHTIVLDLSGKPVPDVDVKVDLFQRKYYSHRKRLVGGFYSYEHVTETKRIGHLCEGRTDSKGLMICEVKSPVSGNVIIQAHTADEAKNISIAHRDVWIAGKGEWWFDVSGSDSIDFLPEKKRYEPGETAKFQAAFCCLHHFKRFFIWKYDYLNFCSFWEWKLW